MGSVSFIPVFSAKIFILFCSLYMDHLATFIALNEWAVSPPKENKLHSTLGQQYIFSKILENSPAQFSLFPTSVKSWHF